MAGEKEEEQDSGPGVLRRVRDGGLLARRRSDKRKYESEQTKSVTIEHLMSLADCQLYLNCWVRGDEADRVFTIEITGTKNVNALKKAINEEKRPALDHVPADNLDLWKVSMHCFDASRSTHDLWQVSVPADDKSPEAVGDLSLDSVKPLWSVQRLSGHFEEAL